MFRNRQKIWVITAVSMFVFFGALASVSANCTGGGDWKDIYILPTNAHPDTNIVVTLTVDKATVVPGDEITFTAIANVDCYLTIMSVGTSGRVVRLWPNDFSGMDNFVRAGVPRRFPDVSDGFRYKIGGPDGVERIIAYATSERGKILTESEFQSFGGSIFKQFVGGVKDLADSFEKSSTALGSKTPWGTKQLNVCIGRGATPDRQTTTSSGTTYILSIGAATGDLKYCTRDAQRIADTLKAKMAVKESNMRLLLGADATYDGVANAMAWLKQVAQPEDTVVIYFSGHGASIPDQPPLDEDDGKDEAFVVYHTGKLTDFPTAIRDKSIMVDDAFNELVKPVQARKKVVIIDSCHSGTITKELVLKSNPFQAHSYVSKLWRWPSEEGQKSLVDRPGKATNYGNDNEAVLAACLDTQSSYEDQSKQAGIFTHYFIEAINGGASTLEQAFEQAKQAVVRETGEFARSSGGQSAEQTPSLTDPHGITKLISLGR